MKDPLKDINERISVLEDLFQKKKRPLEQIQFYSDLLEAAQIRGGILELKRLLQAENLFKDAEVIKDAKCNDDFVAGAEDSSK